MTTTTSYRLLLPFLMIALITGCASPRPISLLEGDENEQRFWHQGQEFLTKSSDNITVEIAYNRETGEYYAFDLAVYNESGTEFLVDPQSFYYLPVNYFGDTLKMVRAENPEQRLLELDKQKSKLEAEDINHSIASALMVTAEITAVAASELSDNSEQEKKELRASIRENRYNRDLENVEIAYESLNVQQQRDFWKTQSLRKTTLFPNQYITGQVFLSRNIKAKEITLYLPVEDKLFSFIYHQKMVKVR